MSRPKLHSFINCFLPVSGRLIGRGRGLVDVPVRFLIIEHDKHGLILVDSGYGPEVLEIKGLKAALYRTATKVPRSGFLTPEIAVDHLGYKMNDIKHVILTHMHADHVCNLGAIPKTAKIHMSQHDILQMKGDLPEGRTSKKFISGEFPELIPEHILDRAVPFETSRQLSVGKLSGLDIPAHDVMGDGSVMVLPLPGHSSVHHGVVFPKGIRNGQGAFVYAADTCWTDGGLRNAPPLLADLVEINRGHSEVSRRTVFALAEKRENRLFCHDPEMRDTDIGVVQARRGK
jgi:glyoxylase-like metal-dependent hydrolase (beta-lactamase superfamily II)